jgi:hypothetical protein
MVTQQPTKRQFTTPVLPPVTDEQIQPEQPRRRILVAPAADIVQRTTTGMTAIAQMAGRVGGNVNPWQASYGRKLQL